MHLSNSDDRVIESNKTVLTSSDMIDIDHKVTIVHVPRIYSVDCSILTCNSNGCEPGSMLLPGEYSLGLFLSREHRTHSVALQRNCRPGNCSIHTEHLDTLNDTMWSELNGRGGGVAVRSMSPVRCG